MFKKIIIPTTLVLGVAGATWIYSAQRFEVEAENTLKLLNQSTDFIKFDIINIDKYFFNVTLGNITFSTTYNEKPISYKTSNPQRLSYNPLTKTVSLSDTDLTGMVELKIANETHAFKYITEDLMVIKTSFKEHPIAVHNDLIEISKNLRQASVHVGKAKVLDAKNDKILSTSDGSDIDIALNVPESATDTYHFDIKLAAKNQVRTKESQEIAIEILKSLNFDSELLNKVENVESSVFGKPISVSGSVAFTAPKGEVDTFAGSLFQQPNAPNKELIPTVQLKADIAYDIPSQKGTFVTNINYQKDGQKLKGDIDSSGTVTADGQNEFKAEMKKIIKETFTDSLINSNDQALSDDDMTKLVPDFTSWNPMVFTVKFEGDFKDQLKIVDLTGRLAFNDIELHVKGAAEKGTYKGQIQLLNHQKLLTSLKDYSQRFIHADTVFNKELATVGYTKEILEQSAALYLTMADKVFKILGKAGTDAKVPSVSYDVTFNEITGDATINGKPLMEAMAAVMQ